MTNIEIHLESGGSYCAPGRLIIPGKAKEETTNDSIKSIIESLIGNKPKTESTTTKPVEYTISGSNKSPLKEGEKEVIEKYILNNFGKKIAESKEYNKHYTKIGNRNIEMYYDGIVFMNNSHIRINIIEDESILH